MIRQAVKSEGTEAEKLNVSGRPVNTDRVPGRKRAATFQRKYAAAVKAIEAGEIEPEIKPVAGYVQCSTRTASSILAKAVDSDGRFSRDSRGRVVFSLLESTALAAGSH